jgi:hypothetical protein
MTNQPAPNGNTTANPSELQVILAKNKKHFFLETWRHEDEALEKSRKVREQDFHRMSVHLTAAFEECDPEELTDHIDNKLALSQLSKVCRDDWWWIPASDPVACTLRDVQRMLRTNTKRGIVKRMSSFGWIWWLLVDLAYLAVVLLMFTVANSKFEMVVIAALVLIYSRISLAGVAFATAALLVGQAFEAVRWEFGSVLKLKIPISGLTKAQESLRKAGLRAVIHASSIGIGSLLALWHLGVALLAA